jgi:hypothetical protein
MMQQLIQQVVQDVPEAPLLTIREMLNRMARELCTEADAWVQRNQPVVVAANTSYPQIMASQGEPLRIISLVIDGRECVQGEGFRQLTPTEVSFDRQPSESLLYGALACRPEIGDSVPDEVLNRWGDVIADGARWRILLLPQPWRDAELASYYQQRYLAGVADARQHSRLGHARGGARVNMRRFI